MAYIKGQDRYQRILFPDCIDEYIESDAPTRLFDKFVDGLDMKELGFERFEPAYTGTPGYDPRDLLKLYIYGYFYQVRSSRKLARECKCNIEVMWMLNRLTPDFRTIADFRKDNKVAITKVFKEFNRFCYGLRIFSKSFISIDGSKFKAWNAKDKNFTLSKLDDRIKRLDEHIALYMEELEACDQEESRKLSKEEVEHNLEVCKDRKERYEGLREQLEQSGESQISLTDPDARLMKQNEGFGVCYNTQTAVDAESHMIAGFLVTNHPTDHGLVTEVASEVKEDYGVPVLETTADKGYGSPEDHANALAAGIVPNVIQRNGSCTETVEFSYKEAEITDEQKASTKPEDLKACLEAGVIPDAYKGILSDVEIAERRVRVLDIPNSDVLNMTAEEMMAKAREGYFVRNPFNNVVYCPEGQELRLKAEKSNGYMRYCNKLACRRCKNKCTKADFKEADFLKDVLIKPMSVRGKKPKDDDKQDPPEGKRHKSVVSKVVRYVLHLDQKKMNERKCLSEHPFGTIKRYLGQYYFLLKGFAKVNAEMSLFCLSYNIRRAISLKGMPALMAALG